MRWTIAAAVSVALLLTTTACQDQQSQAETERLKAEIAELKKNEGGGNDRLVELLLAERQGGGDGIERKLNSFSEDVSAGLAKIREDIRETESATDSRMSKLEDRLARVSDLDETISSLKATIEVLEGKLKNTDPNETLSVLKEKLQAEFNLEAERKARESAEATIAELKDQLDQANTERERLNTEINTLQGEDISGHPDYRALKAELREARAEIKNWESDYESLNRKHQALLEQLGDSGEPAEIKKLPDNYDFSGTVTSVRKGNRPDGPSFVLVGKFKGQTPPIGAQLVVLDEKNERICDIEIKRHYRMNQNDDLPVVELGCETINESPTNPVTNGDRAIWIKSDEDDETGGAAGGE